MQANEFRLGNWVLDSNGRQPTQIMPSDFSATIYTYLEPIPLTEEWLVKLGFRKNGRKDGFQVYTTNMNKNEFCLDNGICVIKDGIKFVHSLQNLYFCLTQKELQICE